jgi:superfamily II RNA helicase
MRKKKPPFRPHKPQRDKGPVFVPFQDRASGGYVPYQAERPVAEPKEDLPDIKDVLQEKQEVENNLAKKNDELLQKNEELAQLKQEMQQKQDEFHAILRSLEQGRAKWLQELRQHSGRAVMIAVERVLSLKTAQNIAIQQRVSDALLRLAEEKSMLVQVPEEQLEQVKALLVEYPHWKAVPSKEDNGVFFCIGIGRVGCFIKGGFG